MSLLFSTRFRYLAFCLSILWTTVAFAQEQLPSNFTTLAPYTDFAANQTVRQKHVIALPKSPYLLVYISKERTEDKDNWSMSPADGTVAKVFVYDSQQHQIDLPKTNHLNKILGADQFYNYKFCGGLGSFENWKVEGTKVVLQQSYAPASDGVECKTYLYYDGKIITATNSANPPSTTNTLGSEVGKERNKKNSEALQLLQNNKTAEAIKIWEELYQNIKQGSYAAEGKIDEYLNNLGFAYWKTKQYDKSEKILLECLQRFPNRHVLYINLGDLYRDMGKKAEAKKYYDKAVKSSLGRKQRKYAKSESKKL